MITLIACIIALCVAGAALAFVLAFSGAAILLVFGDVIVFAIIIVWLIKKLINKK